jgi:hypothetical protein
METGGITNLLVVQKSTIVSKVMFAIMLSEVTLATM